MNLFNIQFNNSRRIGTINSDDNESTLSPLGVGLIIGFLILIFIFIILFSIFL